MNPVVPKTFSAKPAEADPARRWFVVDAEGQALGRLKHESNLGVIEFGQTEDGGFYLVTDLLEGRADAATVYLARRAVAARTRPKSACSGENGPGLMNPASARKGITRSVRSSSSRM